MADGTVAVAEPGSPTKQIDTTSLTVAATTVQRERMVIAGATDVALAVVTNAAPGSSDYALEVRQVDRPTGGGVEATAQRVTIASDSTGVLSVDDNGGSLTVDGTVAVSGTVTVDSELTTADLDTGAGTDTRAVVGIAGAASGGAVLVQATAGGALKADITTIAGTAPTTVGKLDVKGADGDVFVRQATAANLNATVVGTGTFAVQSASTDNLTQIGGTTVVTGGVNGTLGVGGNLAHDAAIASPTSPILAGARADTIADSAPGSEVSADDDITQLRADRDGVLFVNPYHPRSWSAQNTGSLSAASVKGAPGAGLSLYVTGVTFSIGAATASSIKISISGGADLWGPHYLEAINGRGVAVTFPNPLKVTANTALVATTTGATTCTLTTVGFTAPG